MNIKLLIKAIPYIIIIIAILVIAGLSIAVKFYKNESKRYHGNYEAMFDKSLEQNITLKEFKEKYAAIADTLKQYHIKPRQIERVVQIKYQYRDTGSHTVKIVEVPKIVYTIPKNITYTKTFTHSTQCFYISGTVTDTTVTITEQSITDTILIALTKTRKCLFKPPVYRATAISQCKGDTLPVLNNIQIIKKRGKPRAPY